MRIAQFRLKQRKQNPSHVNDEETIARQWHFLFQCGRQPLSLVARILTEGSCSPAIVLFNAETKIRDRQIGDEFQYRFAIRAVVTTALDMPIFGESQEGIELFECAPGDLAQFEDRMAALPFLERRVLFLRDVLEYSRRETALLLKMPDSQVDTLLRFGRHRLSLRRPFALERVKIHFATTRRSLNVEAQRDEFLSGGPSGESQAAGLRA